MAKPKTARFAPGWTESFAALSVICYTSAKKKRPAPADVKLCLLRGAKTLMSADRRAGDSIYNLKVEA